MPANSRWDLIQGFKGQRLRVYNNNINAYRRRVRPKRTWRRTIEDEIINTGRSWNEVKGIAGDHNAWKFCMDVLCSTRS
jgi:hypothetical protein